MANQMSFQIAFLNKAKSNCCKLIKILKKMVSCYNMFSILFLFHCVCEGISLTFGSSSDDDQQKYFRTYF